MPADFITFAHKGGHRSSVAPRGDFLRVVGVLPHGAEIMPASPADAAELHTWAGRHSALPKGWTEKFNGHQTILREDGKVYVWLDGNGAVCIRDTRDERYRSQNSAVSTSTHLDAELVAAITYVVARWGGVK